MQRQAGLTLLSLNGLSPRIPEASDTEPYDAIILNTVYTLSQTPAATKDLGLTWSFHIIPWCMDTLLRLARCQQWGPAGHGWTCQISLGCWPT